MAGEGMTIARRLRLFRRRATRWFQPPVRTGAGAEFEDGPPETARLFVGRGLKPRFGLH
jgi:hypothetical protein